MRSRAALLIVALSFALVGGCSFALEHHDAGLAHLEEAPAPAGPLAIGAKYAGWIASAPLVVGLTPVAALAWATPWVDLPLAVDIATAPGIALGYAVQALVGYPARALFFWTGPPAAERSPRQVDAWRAPPGPGPPWGLVRERWAQDPAPRPTRPLAEEDRARYDVPAWAPALAARVEAALAAAGPGEVAALRLDDEPAMLATLEVTRADGPGARPLVVMTPPLEAAFAARWLAARFARRGAHAAVVVPDALFMQPDLDGPGLERKLAAAVAHGRATVEALAGRPEVSRVVYVGVSAGGIYGAVLLAVEPRVERAALLLPGGDLPVILATSEEPSVVAWREAQAAAGLEAEALVADLRRHVRTDPLRLAPHVDPSRVLLFLGAEDTLVPTACGLRLRRAMGGPATYVLAGDHDTACFAFGFILRRVDAFLGL